MEIKNKVVLVTGSSSGIGKETAIALAEKGARVVVTYNHSKADGMEVLKKCREFSKDCILLKLDVLKDKSILDCFRKIKEEFGRVDILVNNAGILFYKLFKDQSFEEIDSQVMVNLIGEMKVANTALKYLGKSGESVIINIASLASTHPYETLVPYCASKFGVRGFTQTLALELPKNIRVYAVNPNMTATRMTSFKGVPPRKVADVIVRGIEESLGKKSGDDIVIDDYVKPVN